MMMPELSRDSRQQRIRLSLPSLRLRSRGQTGLLFTLGEQIDRTARPVIAFDARLDVLAQAFSDLDLLGHGQLCRHGRWSARWQLK